MQTITFMTTLGVNVGDEFIRHGIRKALKRAGIEYSPLFVNKHDIESLHEYVPGEERRVKDKYFDTDVFIQCGAPVYWHLPSGHTSANAGWYEWLWRDRILTGEKLFLNLGAGSCFPLQQSALEAFGEDEGCQAFLKESLGVSALTTVRDAWAYSIVKDVSAGTAHLLPCPAFFAGEETTPVKGFIGINLMPLAGHYDLGPDFNAEAWDSWIRGFLLYARKMGNLVFIAHDSDERDFMQKYAEGSEVVFLSPSWRDYLDIYSRMEAVVANRVHGAVAAAGCGVPSIILGNDSRALIGEEIGIPVFAPLWLENGPDACINYLEMDLGWRSGKREQLLSRKESGLNQLAAMLKEVL